MNIFEEIQLWRLNQWTEDVCKTTKAEFHKVQEAEKQIQKPASFWQQKFQPALAMYDVLRKASHQGLPAFERYIVHLINPRVKPESLLPDSPLSR